MTARRNPAQRAARFDERAVERFLSPDERKRLEAELAKAAALKPCQPGYIQPNAMGAPRLLALTGMRHSEVCDVRHARGARRDPTPARRGASYRWLQRRGAGQTVMHLHMHVIPRFLGDVDDPRGGGPDAPAGPRHASASAVQWPELDSPATSSDPSPPAPSRLPAGSTSTSSRSAAGAALIGPGSRAPQAQP